MELSGKGATGGEQPWRLAADLQDSEAAMDRVQATLEEEHDQQETVAPAQQEIGDGNIELLQVTCPEDAEEGDTVTVQVRFSLDFHCFSTFLRLFCE